MMDTIFGIHWAAPRLIYLLPVVIAVSAIAFWYVFRARVMIGSWLGDGTRRSLVQNVSIRTVAFKTWCLVGAMVLLFIALLRPQWGMEDALVSGSGRAVLVALDVSRSMCAQDIRPSRIGLAKQKIKELVKMLKADRVGLLIFSGEALILCPMTTDYDAFSMFLDNAAVEAVSSGTTSIGAALEKVLATFNGQEREGTRLVVLFTDGEDFSGRVQDLSEKVRASGIRFCVVGVGSSDGGPIPTYDQQGRQSGFLKDRDGHVVISRPQTPMMQELADKTGGLMVRSSAGSEDMARVRRWIERFERSKFGERHTARHSEQFYWYTAGALLLLLVGWLL